MEQDKPVNDTMTKVLMELRDAQRDMATQLGTIARGFPAGDYDGHRRYHEAVIERMELRNKLIREALTKVVQAGALAGCGWVAVAMWNYFKLSVHQ